MSNCPFCKIATREDPRPLVAEWPETIAFAPLNPVVPGHVLVVPKVHVPDALTDPQVTATTMRRLTEYATRPCNVIANCGATAGQSVFHLHIHVVPRSEGDDVKMPWDFALDTEATRA